MSSPNEYFGEYLSMVPSENQLLDVFARVATQPKSDIFSRVEEEFLAHHSLMLMLCLELNPKISNIVEYRATCSDVIWKYVDRMDNTRLLEDLIEKLDPAISLELVTHAADKYASLADLPGKVNKIYSDYLTKSQKILQDYSDDARADWQIRDVRNFKSRFEKQKGNILEYLKIDVAKEYWDKSVEIQTALAGTLGIEYFPKIKVLQLNDQECFDYYIRVDDCLDVGFGYGSVTQHEDSLRRRAQCGIKNERGVAIIHKYITLDMLISKLIETEQQTCLDKIRQAGIGVETLPNLSEKAIDILAEVKVSIIKTSINQSSFHLSDLWSEHLSRITSRVIDMSGENETLYHAVMRLIKPQIDMWEKEYNEMVLRAQEIVDLMCK